MHAPPPAEAGGDHPGAAAGGPGGGGGGPGGHPADGGGGEAPGPWDEVPPLRPQGPRHRGHRGAGAERGLYRRPRRTGGRGHLL